MGEKTEVYTYSDMLVKVCEFLETLDTDKFRQMAKENYKIGKAIVPLISYDESMLRTPKEVDNTGIYVETNRSANDIVRTIKNLLDEFGLSYDDFIFYTEVAK